VIFELLHVLKHVADGLLLLCSDQVGETGKVVGIEHIDQLVASSVQNIRRIPKLASRLDSGRLTIIAGDGRRGHRVMAPYDVIHVGAASNEIPQEVDTSVCMAVLSI
jgi:protein-L-isoaspartate(D-aspartate) O-methyltransferase